MKTNYLNNKLLLSLVTLLVDAGVEVTLREDGAYLYSGFYKSNGQAKLVSSGDAVVLNTRYDRNYNIETLEDIIEVSREWKVTSERMGGYTTESEWQRLYDAY